MRVAILPTGRTEHAGLAQVFKALFPDHDFYCMPSPEEISSHPDDFPYNGFTSNLLTDAYLTTPPVNAKKLVQRAAQEAVGDRRRDPADLVVILDDVELVNMGQVSLIVDVMRRATQVHLDGLHTQSHARTERALRERVSFHLISPMIEAWFFAAPNTLNALGITGERHPFPDTTDPEDFCTDDPAYLVATEADTCPAHAALPESKKKKLRPKWLGAADRARHPKGYIQWLSRAPGERTCTRYDEVRAGAALAALDWRQIAARPPAQLSLLRALVEDMADVLGQPAIPLGAPTTTQPTSRGAARDPLLRNI